MATTGAVGYHARTPDITVSELQHVEPIRDLEETTRPQGDKVATTLLDVLSNALILRHTAPLLPVAAIYALAGASKDFHELMIHSPDTHRYLDLSPVKSAQLDIGPVDIGGVNWRSERMDEALTPDEFYSGPLRGIMSKLTRRHVLKTVSTMVLDGLAVTSDVVLDIITEDRFNVRILSIREVKHLNERKLMQRLKYVARPSRPEGTPKLKGLYVFGQMDPSSKPPEPTIGRRRSPTRYPDSHPSSVMSAVGAQLGAEWNRRSQESLASQLSNMGDKWWQSSGRMFRKNPASEWAETLKACEGIIQFDAVLCRGPRHDPPTHYSANGDGGDNHHLYLPPAVATVALGPSGCAKCKACPEGPAFFGPSPPEHLPLLAPPPIHSSTLKAAQMPSTADGSGTPRLIIRCTQCLHGRWCERCQKWWCEDCYQPPTTLTHMQQQEVMQIMGWTAADPEQQPDQKEIKMGSKRDCFGCGQTCAMCKELYIRACKTCRNEYCVIDNDGSSAHACDWCNYSGRRTRELY